MLTRITILTAAFGLCLPVLAQAGEILLRADRDRLVQGESAQITITVRGSRVRPLVTPPTIPYCQVEQVQEMQLRSQAPQRGLAGSGAPANGGMARALDDLTRQVQDLPGQLSKQGAGDLGLLKEYDGMLRDIRRQAQEALQTGGSQPSGEYQAVYRVTPQRSGELTLTPFILKIGGSSYLTKALTLHIAPAPPKVDQGAATATADVEGGPSADESSVVGQRGLSLKPWHGLVAVIAAPALGIAIALLTRRRRPPLAEPAHDLRLPSQARRETLARVLAAGNLATVAEVVAEYVRHRCQLPAGELTPAEAAAALRSTGVAELHAGRVAAILDTCAAARFAAGDIAVDQREVAGDARRVITEIESA